MPKILVKTLVFDTFKRPPRAFLGPKLAPGGPQEAPKRPQVAPRMRPRGPLRPRNSPRDAPKIPPKRLPSPPRSQAQRPARCISCKKCRKHKITKNPCKNQGFWHLSEASEGLFGPPKWPPGGPQEVSKKPPEAPRKPQGGPKEAPRCPKAPPRCPQEALWGPRTAPRAPKMPPRGFPDSPDHPPAPSTLHFCCKKDQNTGAVANILKIRQRPNTS